MSLKENVDYIKGEVSAQESMLENVFKVEQFYKKYKTIIFSSVGVIVIALIAMSTMDYMDTKNKLEANELFNSVLEDPNNTDALNKLKQKNQKLYEIASYKIDQTKKVNVEFLNELSSYAMAMEKGELGAIDNVSKKQKFLIKEFAIFNKAVILAKSGKYKEAKESLKLIPVDSNIAGLSKMLEHYLITKK